MKRFWSKSIKYKRYQKKHSLSQLRSRLKYKAWKKGINKSAQNVPRDKSERHHENQWRFKNYEHLTAPEKFSFIENTEAVIRFINILENHLKKRHRVFVNLRKVNLIDYGAIVVLLSIMMGFRDKGIAFNGNFPQEEKPRKLLRKSGFIDNLTLNEKIKSNRTDRLSISPSFVDAIHTHADKKVDSQLGARLIKTYSERIWGDPRRCQGVQRTLLELMQNTNNHADLREVGSKYWWLSSYYSEERNIVGFSFVDFGVGVFTSLENKPTGSKFHDALKKLRSLFPTVSENAKILKLILEGKLHDIVQRRNELHRGKGLPGILKALERNQIANLYIITNDVWSSVGKDEYRRLEHSFNGTFIYWEVTEKNENCK